MQFTNYKNEIQNKWKLGSFCKEPIILTNKCATCGNELAPGWKICPFCATDVQPTNSSIKIHNSVVKEIHG